MLGSKISNDLENKFCDFFYAFEIEEGSKKSYGVGKEQGGDPITR